MAGIVSGRRLYKNLYIIKKMSLFRLEVRKSQSAQWIGVARLGHPLRDSVIVMVALCLGCLTVCFVIWGEVTRKVRVAGVLVPVAGSLNITAPHSGVIAQLRIQEGQTVTAGAVLFVLDTERQSVQDKVIGQIGTQAAEQIILRQQSLASGARCERPKPNNVFGC